MCIPPSLLGNGSVYTFPHQRINKKIRGVAFHAVRVVSKESRLLVLPRTSCCLNFVTNSFPSFSFFGSSCLPFLSCCFLCFYLCPTYILYIFWIVYDRVRSLTMYVCMLCRSPTLMGLSFHVLVQLYFRNCAMWKVKI
jgi:hypothetical protein